MRSDQKQHRTFATNVANTFGFLGYLSLLLEWVLVICIIAYPFVQNGGLDWIVPAHNPEPTPTMAPIPASPLTLVVGIVATIVSLGIMVYAIYKLPQAVGKTGAKVTHKAAHVIAPVITKHRKLPKKALRLLTFRTVIAIKVITALLPVMVVVAIPTFLVLPKNIVVVITTFFAGVALVNFCIQYGLTKLKSVDTTAIW